MSRILIGNVRDKLVNNLLATKAGTGALDAAQGKVLKDLVESVLGQQADAYNKKTYAVGDYCIYENALYKCSTAISSEEEWTAGHWTKTTIANELKSIVESVATVNNAITELNGKTENIFEYTPEYAYKNIITNLLEASVVGNFTKDAMKAGVVATEDASTLRNSPVTSGAFYAYREVFFLNHANNPDGHPKIIVRLTESWPTPGRIWTASYNADILKWSGWSSVGGSSY